MTAHSFPLPQDRKFYEGKELRVESRLVGQNKALQEITRMIEDTEFRDRRAISLLGIGGAG